MRLLLQQLTLKCVESHFVLVCFVNCFGLKWRLNDIIKGQELIGQNSQSEGYKADFDAMKHRRTTARLFILTWRKRGKRGENFSRTDSPHPGGSLRGSRRTRKGKHAVLDSLKVRVLDATIGKRLLDKNGSIGEFKEKLLSKETRFIFECNKERIWIISKTLGHILFGLISGWNLQSFWKVRHSGGSVIMWGYNPIIPFFVF